MGRKLATYVHVHTEDGANSKVFGPDDDVPADVAKLITNPKAWADSDENADERSAEGEEPAGTGGEGESERRRGRPAR